MNKQPNTPEARKTTGRDASGKHEGLRHPIDEKQSEKQRLGDVGLDDEGDVAEDELRDRGSSGAGRGGQGSSKPDDVRH